MGYSGLKNVNSSDMASDLLYACEKAFMIQLSKGLKEIENCFNTSGWVNVALIIESGILDNFCPYSKSFEEFDWKFLVQKLEEEIKNSAIDKSKEWDTEENRKMHHESFKRMLKNVKNFLKKKDISYDV